MKDHTSPSAPIHLRFKAGNNEFELDEAAHRLILCGRRGREKRPLDPVAFDILCYFAKHNQQLVPHDALSNVIADRADYLSSVYAKITLIRHALRLPQGSDVIRSVKRRGYVFDVDMFPASISQDDFTRYLKSVDSHLAEIRSQLFPPVPIDAEVIAHGGAQVSSLVPLYLVESDRSIPTPPKPCTMHSALRQHKRLLVVGAPGAGKTTLVLITGHALRHGRWERIDPGRTTNLHPPVPVIIRLPIMVELFREWGMLSNNVHIRADQLREFILRRLEEGGLPRPSSEQLLGTGQFVFFFDGLDEVPIEFQIGVALSELGTFLRDDWIVICSRPVAREITSTLGADFSQLYVCPLRSKDKWNLLQNRLRDHLRFQEFWRHFVTLPPAVSQLTNSPLILSVLAYLFECNGLPDEWRIHLIYEKTIFNLIGPFMVERRRKGRSETMKRISLFDALCAAAFEVSEGRIDSRACMAVSASDYWPTNCPQEDERKDEFLDQFLSDTPLLPGPRHEKQPLHRSFMEYAYARFLSQRNPKPHLPIVKQWQQSGFTSWVPLFFAQIAEPITIRAMFKEMKRYLGESVRAKLSYARAAIQSSQEVSISRAEIREMLLSLWEAGEKGSRQESSTLEVRREAAEILGLDDEFVKQCCERLEKPGDSEELSRAADLLLEMASPHSTPSLVRQLDAEDNRVRWGAVQVLGRVGFFQAISEFKRRWPIEKDWDIQVAMLVAASHIPSDEFDSLLEIAQRGSVREVVSWEAEILEKARKGEGLVASVSAADSLSISTDRSREGVEVIGSRLCKSLDSNVDSERIEAAAALLVANDSGSEFAIALADCLTPKLIDQLRREQSIKGAWQLARSIRTMVKNRDNSPSIVGSICEVYDGLETIKRGLARGELARALGELRSPYGIDLLCNNYSPDGDEHERLWIMYSLWQLAHLELTPKRRALIKKCTSQALRSDSYSRTRHWAELTRRIV